MGDTRRKLPSWMLGVKNNDTSNDNCSEKDEKLVKARRQGKRVLDEKMKIDGDDDDEFERESSDVGIGCDGGGDRRIRRKGNGECDKGSREGKKKDPGVRDNVKGRIVDEMVDDGIGYGKRKNSVKERKEKLEGDDYVDGDNGIAGGKRNKGGRKRKGDGKIDGAEIKKLELEEDGVEDDDDGGDQVVMRRCKGKRRADRGELVDSIDSLDVQGGLESASDDEDLTVADLVSIAEEYVNKDMESAQQVSLSQDVSNVGNSMRTRNEHPIENEEIGENHTFETSIHDNIQSGESFNSKLLNGEDTRPHGILNKNMTVMKPIMSGDPAQDMLDLFLGHLLNKPQEEENKLDTSLAVQRQEPVDPPVDGVAYTKKKSSLKDKVAMFFD